MKALNFKPSECTCKKIVLLLMLFFDALTGYSQENKFEFSGIYNFQEGEDRSPMIGLVNESRNTSHSLQLGLVNEAHDGVKGTQIGLVNSNNAGLNGSTIAIINHLDYVQAGATIGIVNQAETHLKDATIGLVNQSNQSSEGFQLGLVNLTKDHSKGLRIGLVNQSRNHEGLMIGLVNKADSLMGKAIGLINLLKQDVFVALSANYQFDKWGEFQFKSGIEDLYGIISYQKGFYQFIELHAIGYGIGTRIPISQKIFISHEILYHSQINPFWNSKDKSSHKFSANFNLILPVSRRVELVYAKNLHYSKNNPLFP